MLELIQVNIVKPQVSESSGYNNQGNIKSYFTESPLDPEKYALILEELYSTLKNLQIKMQKKIAEEGGNTFSDIEMKINEYVARNQDKLDRDDVSDTT